MSGLGRRSHYRKHLTDSVWNDLPEPDFTNGELIAKVVGTRGSNQFEIVVAQPPTIPKEHNDDNNDLIENISDKNDENPIPQLTKMEEENISNLEKNNDSSIDEISQLAILPAKFRKLVWVKRNDFVIVTSGNSSDDPVSPGDISGGIRYMVKHILYKEQVKHLKQKKMWPNGLKFSESDEEENRTKNEPTFEPDHENKQINKLHKENSVLIDRQAEDDGIVYDESSYNDEYFVNTNRISKLIIDDSESDSD
jgi:probable RNA-binding protein EIF1AD